MQSISDLNCKNTALRTGGYGTSGICYDRDKIDDIKSYLILSLQPTYNGDYYGWMSNDDGNLYNADRIGFKNGIVSNHGRVYNAYANCK